jgi:small subunit ribosomal protein S24e
MEVKIIQDQQNALLKRREVHFQVEHSQQGTTPQRLETKKALGDTLKLNSDMIFIKKLETKTGTNTAFGVANIYDSIEQAKLIEPEYIVKRNTAPAEKPPEKEEKG